MRRPIKNKRVLEPDEIYGSVKVTKLINYVMERGKKDTARRVVYRAMDELKKHGEPLVILEESLEKVGPTVEVRSRRVGGANYQVPREMPPHRRLALALRWIVAEAEGKKGVPMHTALANEILSAHKGEGAAIAKRDTTHRMAEANKVFAHFSW